MKYLKLFEQEEEWWNEPSKYDRIERRKQPKIVKRDVAEEWQNAWEDDVRQNRERLNYDIDEIIEKLENGDLVAGYGKSSQIWIDNDNGELFTIYPDDELDAKKWFISRNGESEEISVMDVGKIISFIR